jgi:CHAD domain-containing protein
LGRRELARLRRVAQYERRRATSAALEILESRRYARLILQFQRWVASLAIDAADAALERPVVPFARRMLRDTRRELLAEKRPLPRLAPATLHEVRKRGKKSRYAMEFFSSLWPAETVSAYLSTMEALQDRLGESNDASVAVRLLSALRPGRLDPEVLEPVQRWTNTRVTECITAAQPHWRNLRRAKAFWSAKPVPAR